MLSFKEKRAIQKRIKTLYSELEGAKGFKEKRELQKSIKEEYLKLSVDTPEEGSSTVTYVITPAQYPNNNEILVKDLERNGFSGGVISPNKKGWSGDVVTISTDDKEGLLSFIRKRYDPMQEAYDLEGKISGYYLEKDTQKPIEDIEPGGATELIEEIKESLKRVKKVLSDKSSTKEDYLALEDSITVIEKNEELLGKDETYKEVIALLQKLTGGTTQDSLFDFVTEDSISHGKITKTHEYRTYKAWKSAVKKLDPHAKFTGDEDIDSAFKKGLYDAEWDGDSGEIRPF